MQTVREPTLPENRRPETAVPPAGEPTASEPKTAPEPRAEREPRWVRFAASAAFAVILLTALAIAYVAVVVPAELAVLLSVWIGSMGLVVALPLFVVAAATGAIDGRRPRPVTAPDEGLAGRRVG